MINHVYRLYTPKQIRVDLVDEILDNDSIIVRPTYLSICAADMRYYTGNRDKEALKKKLPMALIHEAVGKVLYDPAGRIKIGTHVAMIPNTPTEEDDVIKENYRRSSYFKSSGYDGFMEDVVVIKRDRVVKYEDIEDRIAVLAELTSVGMSALEHFEEKSHARRRTIGIWGSGSVGYVMSLILKKKFPNSKIIVFGPHEDKLKYFSFADETVLTSDIPSTLKVDHAFECVGGKNSQDAINQIIDHINPEGTMCLMGVSESNVPINTRMILEKGLVLLGNSRSSYNDFYNSLKFMKDYPDTVDYLNNIISDEIDVHNVYDMNSAFEANQINDFKTLMKWNV